MGKFKLFPDDELYMLKRQALEASAEIVLSRKYSQFEQDIHNYLLNEIIDEIKRRYEAGHDK